MDKNSVSICLKDFIKTGNWGSIQLGHSTMDEVIRLMGSGFDQADAYDTLIIRYGWYEFFFWKKTKILYAIQNDQLAYDCDNHAEITLVETGQISLDTWFIEENKIGLQEVLLYLKDEQIPYRYTKETDYVKLICASGVSLEFSKDLQFIGEASPREGILTAIRYFKLH